MRVTVSIPDPIGREVEQIAREESTSVSALFTRAVERYIQELRRERAIMRINSLIGKVDIAPNALEELERDRAGSERNRA